MQSQSIPQLSLYNRSEAGILGNKNIKIQTIILIICTAIIANIDTLAPYYYPKHDTLTVYQFFSYFYSEIIYNQEIPLWLPYTAYGIPSDSYLLFSFGPFQYLAIFIGCIFNITNTLHLFVTSLICESIFLMFGAYLFLRHIINNQLPVIISVIFTGLLAQHDIQLYWNFKILLPIPLSLYLAHKWIETLNPVYFLSSLANLILWSFGSLPYVIPLQFYIIACYCFFLIFYKIKIKDINKENILKIYETAKTQILNKKNQIYSLLPITTIGICLSVIITIKHVINREMAYSAAAGRQTNLKVSLDSYLNHGDFTDWHKVLEMLNGFPYCKNFLLPFTGIICIAFAIIGILSKNKTKSHVSLLISTIFIIAFSVKGTYVARIMYYFPEMDVFRHIAYVITIGKIFVVMLAGFGIQSFLKPNNQNFIYPKLIPFIIAIISIFLSKFNFNNPYTLANLIISSTIIGVTVFDYFFPINRKTFLTILIIIGFIEILQYNLILYSRSPTSHSNSNDLLMIKKSVFKYERTPPKNDSYFKSTGAYYGISGDYLQKDFIPSLRQDIISADLERLLEKRSKKITPIFFGKKLNDFDNIILTTGDPKFDDDLQKFLGKNSPKIKLTNNVIYASSNSQALIMSENASLENQPIITVPNKAYLSPTIQKNIIPLYTITNTYFSSNKHRFLVNNFNDIPLWLIYTDTNNINWHAFVDDISDNIYPANVAFKAIQIPPGSHKIDFIYSKSTLLFKLFFVLQILLGLGIIIKIISYPLSKG